MLLPEKQLPDEINEGDYLEVFIYRDSEDRLIATTRKPLAAAGDLAYLKVTAKTSIGAFLDFGLERGLFLPFSEQKFPLEIGKSYLVYVYVDKSGRLSSTTDIYKYLSSNSPYVKNDKVAGTVYLVKPEVGAFVAVDNRFKALVPASELFREVQPGDLIEARVIRVREDGKLDLSPREVAHKQMDLDANLLLQAMTKNQGLLPLDEKADPKEIEKRFHVSKAAYKRAIGHLLKEGKIVKEGTGIRLK